MKKLAKSPLVLTALWVLSAACLCTDLAFTYKAGCSGDLKGGTVGNFQEALNYESIGFLFLVIGVLTASVTASIVGTLRPVFRLAQGLIAFAVIWILMFILGMQIEIWGNRTCLLS